MKCGCKMFENKLDSKRLSTKVLLTVMERENPDIKKNIFNSLGNVDIGFMEIVQRIKQGQV